MQVGDKRNTTRKAQIFWGLIAAALALFCLVWFRHSNLKLHFIVPVARPYLDLARTGWVIAVASAAATFGITLFLPFEMSEMAFLALALSWALSFIFMVTAEVLIVKKDRLCPVYQQCINKKDPGLICSYVATVTSLLQFLFLGAAFFQVRAFKTDLARRRESSTEKATTEKCKRPGSSRPKSGIAKFLNADTFSNIWTAGIKPLHGFRDRP
ncbi:hypothetical protein K432DRAFT_154722 [Lepidopterella palustris CBS 459.81]|uniref:MARVEL domain-containing protein n=1 Tax=Lepidopterella palustris CBS 459.81 TaxID=1314670 RepID=A0A8E2JJ43_9PEZI|nr:hypothetical protein K432DRAFT_154722 [Lepidopterella palustris CBS 459.81]